MKMLEMILMSLSTVGALLVVQILVSLLTRRWQGAAASSRSEGSTL
ncbi:MAG: hypothetical protein HQL51_08670 [Magnetococcales bacterium]|nr:hypothetical protein [Magnetococcales bacterium]